MHDLVPYHNSKRTGPFLECNGIPGNSPGRNFIENVWNLMKKEIGNQMPRLKKEMW